MRQRGFRCCFCDVCERCSAAGWLLHALGCREVHIFMAPLPFAGSLLSYAWTVRRAGFGVSFTFGFRQGSLLQARELKSLKVPWSWQPWQCRRRAHPSRRPSALRQNLFFSPHAAGMSFELCIWASREGRTPMSKLEFERKVLYLPRSHLCPRMAQHPL